MKSSFALMLLSGLAALAAPAIQKRAGRFAMFGVNESGGEFEIPQWPSTQTIDTLIADGFNTFRVLFTMENMCPEALGTVNATYLGAPAQGQPASPNSLYGIAQYITSKKANAILAPWNFGQYKKQNLDADGMTKFWTAVAAPFADMDGVIFDTNNEYNLPDQQLVFDLNQAAINGIRAAKATKQTIMVEGNKYTKAMYWATTNDNLKGLTDPSNKIVYQMHQYLDQQENASGQECIRGKDALTDATAWLKTNQKQGFLGEFAAGNSDNCTKVVTDMLNYMATEKSWLGALWWGGGQADDAQHFFAFNPPSSQAYSFWLNTLKQLS